MSRRNYSLTPYKLQQVTAYIEAHLDEPLTVSTLAAVVGYRSRFHFCRCFKRAVGVPPYQYVIRARLARAQQLLRDTELPISRVAVAVGCYDQSHLALYFRRAEARTPKMVRAQRGGD